MRSENAEERKNKKILLHMEKKERKNKRNQQTLFALRFFFHFAILQFSIHCARQHRAKCKYVHCTHVREDTSGVITA